MRAPLFALLLLLPVPALALTPAEFLQQAADSSKDDKRDIAIDAARNRLLALIGRYPDLPLGVSIADTIQTADVLPVYIAPLVRLKGFTPTAFDVLQPTGRVFALVYYPAPEAGKAVVSSLQLSKTPVGWETARMGDGAYARLVWDIYVRKERRPANAILLQVPALGIDFIAFVKKGELQLEPISRAAGHEFDSTDAGKVLQKLHAKAATHNGQLN